MQLFLLAILTQTKKKTTSKMSKLLDKPAKKFFLIDLCQCSEITNDLSNSSSNRKEWLTNCAGMKIKFSVVFVQGIVVEIMDEGNSVTIDDGTSIAVITGCNSLPFTTIKPCKGHYVMVIGQLLKSGTIPMIRPIKLQNLNHNVSLSVMWPIEVIDSLQQNGCEIDT